jgi:hypothetical protein
VTSLVDQEVNPDRNNHAGQAGHQGQHESATFAQITQVELAAGL